jgi:hypothetical protein
MFSDNFEQGIDLDETRFSRQHAKYSGLGNTPDNTPDNPYNFDLDDDESEPGIRGCHTTETMPMPRHMLRSRPAINFSACDSSTGTDFSFPASAAAYQTATSMSGSTRYSGVNATAIPPPPKKASLGPGPGVPSPSVPVQVIASLTISDLHWNPHYRKLRQQFDFVSQTLAQYAERALMESHALRNEPSIPDKLRGV